jgi:enoyl-CoA hydratase/carnithine racemase
MVELLLPKLKEWQADPEVALACDIRICEQQAQLALPEAKVGLLPCAGGTQHLSLLVGEGWAKRMILCGERITAEKALQIGLVEEVVEKGAAFDAAMKLATQTADQSPTSITVCKTLIQAGRDMSINQALPLEREMFVGLFDSKDQKEGVNAFLEKRKPTWLNE